MIPAIKVCGMRNTLNIEQVLALKPDYMGFIFYKQSKRNATGILSASQLKSMPTTTKKIGVFVDAGFEEIAQAVKTYTLDGVQLHGNESAAFIQELHEKLPFMILLKAIPVDANTDFNAYKPFEAFVNYFLLDTKGPNAGGNGVKFNWDQLQAYTLSKPYFLSGGIEPSDIRALAALAKRDSKFYAVDINSRFETEPGLKNVTALKAFFSELRNG